MKDERERGEKERERERESAAIFAERQTQLRFTRSHSNTHKELNEQCTVENEKTL